ncbi:unnamed protein product [Cunninghamella blakesleeana]
MSQYFSNHSLVHFETNDINSSNNNIQREVKIKENETQQPTIGLGLLVDNNTKQDQTKRRNSLPLVPTAKPTSNNKNLITPPKKINLPPPPTILFDGSSIAPTKDTMFPYIKHIIPLPSPNYIDENHLPSHHHQQHLISPFIPTSSSLTLSSTSSTSLSPLVSNIETHYSQMDLNSPTSSVSSSEDISYTPIENKEIVKENHEEENEDQISNIPVIALSPSIIRSKQQRMPDLTEYPILGDIDIDNDDEIYNQQKNSYKDDDSLNNIIINNNNNNESLMINHLLSPGLMSSSSTPKSSTSSISSTTSFMIREQRSLLSPSLPTYDESTLIGKTLWKYKIDRLLGVGAFSKVYLATSIDQKNNSNNNSEKDDDDDNDYHHHHHQSAIKMISKSKLLKDLRMKSSIEREIAVLQLLHHSSIVQLQATMEIEKHICLLLEYVNGGELFDFVQQKCMMISDDQINEPLVQDLFLQLITVVNWMHDQNVVHRDLKLESKFIYMYIIIYLYIYLFYLFNIYK